MWSLLVKLLKRAGARTLLAASAVTFVVLAFALWLMLMRTLEIEQRRTTEAASLRVEIDRLSELIARANQKAEELSKELEVQQRRYDTARRLAANTAELYTWWQRLWMSEEERRAVEQREELARRTEQEANELLAKARDAQKEVLSELNTLLSGKVSAGERLVVLEREADPFMQALRESWERLRPWLYGAILGILFGPLAWKAFCFFLWAPWVQQAREPVAQSDVEPPRVAQAGPSVSVSLAPGETLLVRPACARSSGESLERSHRWILDWRHPLTSLAAGLYGLYGYTATQSPSSVAVVPPVSAGIEDCVEVVLPEGASIVLRPNAVAAVVPGPGTRGPRVRARWLFGSRGAWLALQFRVLEYSGPCRVVLCGSRGLREVATDGFGQRVRPGSVIARTSSLVWGCRRAETFWGYAWAGEPLFDEVYRGRGWLLTQDGASPEDRVSARWWNGFGEAVLRLFGL